jgi:D-glycero-D-manno-heptose 1,7-bisphosphate phosphatase
MTDLFRSAVFLDRDGVINEETGYVSSVDELAWIDGAPEAIARLNRAGFLVMVVTNQAGIARGYHSVADVVRLHDYMRDELARRGAAVDAFDYCPHHPDFGPPCVCRKPAPGMILRLARRWRIDVARSWLVGDKRSDIEAGLAAGLAPVLVRTGYGREYEPSVAGSAPVVDDLSAACDLIVGAPPKAP